MTGFHGGPADGRSLSCRRAPIFLRVVIGPRGKLDALDQLLDEPRKTETIHVYRKRDGSGGHVCVRPGGCFEMGEYDYLPDVVGEEMRETSVWRAWVDERAVTEGLCPP